MTQPYYSDPTWGWLGPASDVLAVGQFAALVPVIFVVGGLLPPSRPSPLYPGRRPRGGVGGLGSAGG